MKFAILIAAVLLAGCSDAPSDGPDQCLRAELFKACMAILPAGPLATKYNDWNEVVSECGNAAYYQSKRLTIHIKPECRAY